MILSDTGITLNKSVDWLKKYEPIKDKIEDIKTATLWKKKKSTFEPDYCAVKLKMILGLYNLLNIMKKLELKN